MAQFDSNIFMQRAQLEQAQPNVMDRLAQGFQMGLQKQQMDLQRRQLQAKSLDLSALSEQALFKAAQGIPLSPQEQAAIEAQSVIKGQQTYIDPVTQQMVTQPSLNDRAAGLLGRLSSPPAQNLPQQGFNGPSAPVPRVDRLGIPLEQQLDNSPKALSNALGVPVDVIRAAQADFANVKPVIGLGPLKVSGDLAGSPRASVMEAEAQLKSDVESSQKLKEAQILGLKPIEGFTPSPTATKAVQEISAAMGTLKPLMQAKRELVINGPPAIGSADAARLDQINKQLLLEMKNLKTLGTLDAQMERVGTTVTGDVAYGFDAFKPLNSIVDTYAKVTGGGKYTKKILDDADKYLEDTYINSIKAYGYEPTAKQKTPAISYQEYFK